MANLCSTIIYNYKYSVVQSAFSCWPIKLSRMCHIILSLFTFGKLCKSQFTTHKQHLNIAAKSRESVS